MFKEILKDITKDKVLSFLVLTSLVLFIIVMFVNYSPKKEKVVVSTTTYNESSSISPVYTSYREGSDGFNRVIADLKYYTTKSSREVHDFKKLTGIKDGVAESLYHTKNVSQHSMLDTFSDWIGVTPETEGTLILYNKDSGTYSTKPVKSIKLSYNSSLSEIKYLYSSTYKGYYGAPSPIYSYTPTVEIVVYDDDSYEWKYNEDWKMDNEDELKSYISSSPKKED